MPDLSSLKTTLHDWTVLAGFFVGLILVVSALLTSSGLATGLCDDNLAFTTPDADFSIRYENATNDVTIQYQDGDTLSAEWTDALFVRVYADQSANTTTYPLANTSEAFPVVSGDRFTLYNVTIGGRALASGDSIWAVWRGSEKPFPSYCLNDRKGDTTGTAVLSDYVVA